MVRNLFLLRHGQAAHDFNLKDFDRPLTGAGRNQLEAMFARLHDEGFYPDKVYCSPSRRTMETCSIFVEHVNYTIPVQYENDIYEASVEKLFKILTASNDQETSILMIGHNPGISYLYDYLSDNKSRRPQFSGLAPGELVQLVFENLSWAEVSKGLGLRKEI